MDSTPLIKEYICPVCGKIFVPAPFHSYKVQDKKCRYYLVCSYSCTRQAEKSGKWHKAKSYVK